jgi:signal transduction histidine kinase
MEKEQENEVLRFDPSAYLQRLIGRELISTEYIAVAELVKNAYDAGATEVIVELKKDPPQKLAISDNGLGMSLEEFERLWMVPGYSEKVEAGEAAGRPLLGEKGIGRFAADRLAEKLTVVTKRVGEDDALCVVFDWKEFEDRNKKMRDIPIPYSRKPDTGLEAWDSGTKLELEELRKEWTGNDWRKLRRELQSLVTPFRTVHRFKIIAKAEGWESGEVKSPFEAQEGYKYTFSLPKGGRRTRRLSRPKRIAKQLGKEIEESERKTVGTKSFGPIRGAFYYVDHPRSLTKRGFQSGVAVYRDGFRVEPYGRSDDDWLEVKSKKASRHGHAPITPSRLFGFIEITRDENPKLKDVTNREGLLDTPEFAEFRDFVKGEFEYFAGIVEQEKELEPESKAYEAQRAREARVVRQRTWAEIASQLAHQLRQPLEIIGLEAGTLEAWLRKRRLLDDEILEATRNIRLSVEDINDHITLMRRRAKCSRAPIVQFNVCEWIQEKLESLKRQCDAKGVTVQLQSCQEEVVVTFSREALGFVLDNFLQNALNAVAGIDDRPKEIIASVKRTKDGAYRVIVQDNGSGVPVQYRDRILKEAVPSQTGGTGFGLLYAQDVIEENGGRLGFESLEPLGTSFYVEFKDQEVTSE